jgi:hypothetical protein
MGESLSHQIQSLIWIMQGLIYMRGESRIRPRLDLPKAAPSRLEQGNFVFDFEVGLVSGVPCGSEAGRAAVDWNWTRMRS